MAKTRKLTVEILGDAKGAMTAFGQVSKGADNIGSQFVAFGKKAALGFAAFTAGAVVIGKDLVNAASDLNENLSKTEVVFGDAADAVIAFADKAADSFGQSKNQALQAAGSFGVFGKAAGLTGKDLSGFTTDLIGLSSDMASFSNTTPQEAIEAIGAALRGEAEPIRKYGVLLDDATMRQKAMEMGIYDGNGSLTAQQKILAANALIFEQTSDAQGDFARTSDGLANQQRILAARFDNLKTRIGSAFLPVALKVADVFMKIIERVSPLVERWLPKLGDLFKTVANTVQPFVQSLVEKLEPILSKIIGWMKENIDVVKVFFGVIAGAAVVAAVVGLAAAFASMFNPITLIIAAFAAVAAGVYYAYTRFEWFRDGVAAVGRFFTESLVPAFKSAFEAVSNIVSVAVDLIQIYWRTFGDTILSYIKNVFEAVKTIFQGAFQYVKGIFDVFIGVFTGDWSRAWDGVKQIFGGALEMLKGAAKLAIAPIVAAFNMIKDGIAAAIGLMKDVIGAAVGWIVSKFKSGFGILADAAKAVFSGITGTIKSLLSGAINFFINAINKVIGVINTAIKAYNRIPLAPNISTIAPVPQVQLAKGGIVTGPTIALVGEAGPEMVVPLTGPYRPDFMDSAPSSGAQQIIINVQAGLISSPDQIGQEIIEAIKRAERRSGKVFASA
jgi:phage-related protein